MFRLVVKSSHYFAHGNTAHGAHFLYTSAFDGLNKIFVLTGPQGTGKSTVIQSLADSLLDKGLHVQCFHSPLRPDELDGIILTELKVGIVDERVCKGISDSGAGEIVFIHFEEAFDDSLILPEHFITIEDLRGKLERAYSKAYETFAAALRIHDEWEKYYIDNMDFAKADQIAQELIQELYAGHESDTSTAPRHLFFGAATPRGALDFIQSLTAQLERRIFIKGRAGSGKSTLLKKLASTAEQKGIEVQVFHCGFDPNSLDMLIFPELRTAIFDSTAPHEYFPDRDGDEILDMYARTIAPGTDEAYAAEIAGIKARYSAKMKEATSHLAEVEAIDSQIKAYYVAATDFSIVEKLHLHLQSELNELIGSIQLSE
ncbi:PRK06851 family protein [Paenibacillus lautus]|uniref:PRK06851 family protein n=1 Tax=Paenibacillus lautus TaxID=1401 RepID=UPI002DB980B8|nr:PRK06851 family protein [Paenibacillus lautus]MEC0201112.1 PRK06851 family protein [Paenibacillus lautus]